MTGYETARRAAVKQVKSRFEADHYIQGLIIPLLERVGLNVVVKHTDKHFTLKIALPRA